MSSDRWIPEQTRLSGPAATWQSKNNRAGPDSGPEKPSKVDFASEGFEVREEVTVPDRDGRVSSVPWWYAADMWSDWYDDSRDMETVVRDTESGELTGFSTPNRFTPEYRERLYAKSQALERGLRERWGKLLHTVMVTLTASSTDALGRPRSPVDHLEDLLSSWEAVRRSLSRVLEGREWEYLAILEPHESGYTHVHIGVFVRGPVVEEQFQDVLDAHVRNCDGAMETAHRVEEETVRVRRASHPSRQDGVENLGAYLASYMAGDYGAEATEMPEHVQRFYATLWATGHQMFRPSNGAQELMQPEEDEEDSSEWVMAGISPDGEWTCEDDLVEVDGGGCVETVRVGDRLPPPDWGD